MRDPRWPWADLSHPALSRCMFVYAAPRLNDQAQRALTQQLLATLGEAGEQDGVSWLVYRPLWAARGDYANACRRAPQGALAMFVAAEDEALEQVSASRLAGLDGLKLDTCGPRRWREVLKAGFTQQRQLCQTASGGSFFAQLELAIEPSIEPLRLSRHPEDERDVDKRFATNLAIEELAHEAAWLGLKTGHLTLSAVMIHLVDFKPQVYRTCARCALRTLIDEQTFEDLDKMS